MSNPLAPGLDGAQQATIKRAARHATGQEPQVEHTPSIGEQVKRAALPFDVEVPVADRPNPYAPTGWRRKERVEFDVRLPSGQLCRVLRLEREDLFRLNLMSYLDTFTPMLMEDSISTEERNKRMQDTMLKNPDSLANMFIAIDEVVMAATIKPHVTKDENKVDYGGPDDWAKSSFIATAYIEDISMDDRMAIFAASFGRSMEDLKSIWGEAGGLDSLADESSVPPATESSL
jgi:hypothetical protein